MVLKKESRFQTQRISRPLFHFETNSVKDMHLFQKLTELCVHIFARDFIVTLRRYICFLIEDNTLKMYRYIANDANVTVRLSCCRAHHSDCVHPEEAGPGAGTHHGQRSGGLHADHSRQALHIRLRQAQQVSTLYLPRYGLSCRAVTYGLEKSYSTNAGDGRNTNYLLNDKLITSRKFHHLSI